MHRSALSIIFLIAHCLIQSALAADPTVPTVSLFSPQGVARDVQQVRASFSQPMISFGSGQKPAPFDMNCSSDQYIKLATSRWADQNNWVLDFSEPLPAGVRCSFHLRSGLTTVDGKKLHAQSFEFSTGGPAIRSSIPYTGAEIEEEQLFLLQLDGDVDHGSLADKVWFEIEGIASRVPARVVRGNDLRQVLKSVYQNRKVKNVLGLQARQTFPGASKVTLVWGAGIRARSGVATETEQRQDFRTRPQFSAMLSCERPSSNESCIPISPIRVEFSEQVDQALLKQVGLKDKSGRSWEPSLDADSSTAQSVTFKPPFPENTELTVALPSGIRDQSNRSLGNAASFPLTFKTGRYPALVKFAAPFGVLESQHPVLPVTVRNLSGLLQAQASEAALKARILKVEEPLAMRSWQRLVKESHDYWWMRQNPNDNTGPQRREQSIFSLREPKGPLRVVEIPRPSGSESFEVVGIPLPGPGFYVVEIESPELGRYLLGEEKKVFVSSSALVTGMGTHLKWGNENSLIWVTNLASGAPEPDVTVDVYDCTGKRLHTGRTDRDGIAYAELPKESEVTSCSNSDGCLFAVAEKGDDLSLVFSSWDEGIESWRFDLRSDYWYYEPRAAHTILARNLLRPGDTVHMKHVLRRRTMDGFEVPGAPDFPVTLRISHPASSRKYDQTVKFDASGTAESTWTIPESANLGQYVISLISGESECGEDEDCSDYNSGQTLVSGNFTVAAFRVPLMRGYLKAPASALVNPASLTFEAGANYLAGGGASALPVNLRYSIANRPVTFSDYSDFTLGSARTKVGTSRTRYESEQLPPSSEVKSLPTRLDKDGAASIMVSSLPTLDKPAQLAAELEFKDPSGETQTISASANLWPADVVAGIKTEGWVRNDKEFEVQALVLDTQGKPVADQPVRISTFTRKTFSHRKRLLGGFYSYDNTTQVKAAGEACSGRTDARGVLRCRVKPAQGGNLILETEVIDKAGRRSYASRSVWVAGSNYWFEPEDHDRIDLIPEQKQYEPGDTAKFQVRMPFSQATALITAEREGVKTVFVKELSGQSPVIEVPVLPAYAPNIYISAMVVRGRVSDVAPGPVIDLGKPAFKLGAAKIDVGWQPYRLDVKLKADREVYRVREKARFTVDVRGPDGRVPADLDVAVAAVDKGLLELMPNPSWDLLSAMMGQRSWTVRNFTSQLHVIGKRHFGLKGVPRGGGGGRQPTRELFDTLLFWKARLRPDANGHAEFEVPLNDSLTAFKIVAVAQGGVGSFGTAETEIRSTQDLMIFSGLPQVVRQGDKLPAIFTVRNTTAEPMDLDLALTAGETVLPRQKVSLAAGQSSEISWRIEIPPEASGLTYTFEAHAAGKLLDSMKITQQVKAAVPLTVRQATLAQLDGSFDLPVERPVESLPAKGGLRVALAPSLAGSLSGVRRYMQEYPYSCMEQKVSRAVALNDKKMWADITNVMPTYVGSDGLLRFFPVPSSCAQPVLTSYVVSIADEAGFTIPDDVLSKLLEALENVARGTVSTCAWLEGNTMLDRISALNALSRHGRAVLDDVLALRPDPALLPTSALIEWYELMRRFKGSEKARKQFAQAASVLRSRLNFQGSIMGFSTEASDYLWWIFASGDLNAVRLVLAVLEEPEWKQDMGRLMRGAIERQQRGHWDLTLANAWGALAVRKFIREFESAPVSGTTSVKAGSQSRTLDWKDQGGELLLPWPAASTNLQLRHAGSGKPWALIQSIAAVPLKEPLRSGFSIKRSLSPVEVKTPGKFTRGDILRVSITVNSDADRSWVVISDPVPAGATVLGSGFANESQLARRGEKNDYWSSPTFEERSFEWFRAYYEYLPRGEATVEYTVRLNSSGDLQLPPTRVEAMYSPEMFGEQPNETMNVAAE